MASDRLAAVAVLLGAAALIVILDTPYEQQPICRVPSTTAAPAYTADKLRLHTKIV